MIAYRVASLLLLVGSLSAMPAIAADGTPFAWPGDRKAAVSLAYDDALDSQLDHAVPALDRYGFKGSFYLTLANESVRTRLPGWRAVAASGHELGNHTLFHQCSASLKDREWVVPARDLDKTTVAQMQDQVLLANTILQAIDGRTVRTMTVPCGDVRAAAGNYIDQVEDQFAGIKVSGGAITPDMWKLDRHAVTVDAPAGVTGKQLIGVVEEAARRGTMVNFTFHGIGGDYLAVSSEAHEELLAYLDAHRDVYWVATFLEIMQYVQDQQAAGPLQTPP
ncbi:MAG: polysaccharide deacetylase [Oxalobacteraceae bacterium]|nr:MAG: polysaccharide deacetylase [Oxalobacteraceae bacterium]